MALKLFGYFFELIGMSEQDTKLALSREREYAGKEAIFTTDKLMMEKQKYNGLGDFDAAHAEAVHRDYPSLTSTYGSGIYGSTKKSRGEYPSLNPHPDDAFAKYMR